MPIIVDTTQDNLDEQLKQAAHTVALTKQVDAKYFSKSLTGNGKRKSGVLSTDSDTITDFMQEKRRLLDMVPVNDAYHKNRSRHQEQVFGNFYHQSAKSKTDSFEKFENNLTTMVPPVIIESVIADAKALTVPRSIGLYGISTMDVSWDKVLTGTIDGKPATTYAKVVVQSLRLYSRETTKTSSKSGIQSKETQIAGVPEIYVLFATALDKMNDDGDMIFTNHKPKNVNKRQGIISVHPLKEASSTRMDYDDLQSKLSIHVNDLIANQSKSLPKNVISAYDLSLLIGDQSLSDLLTGQATMITHQVDTILSEFVDVYAKRTSDFIKKGARHKNTIQDMVNGLLTFVQHIDLLNAMEDDLISTDLLANVYALLKTHLEDSLLINKIARHSLRLLLSQRLHELDEIRKSDGLYKFEPVNASVNLAMDHNPNYSTQQKRIVTTTDPLVIGQAGAGSGKSHTLVGRINFLRDHGEDLKKALVLSFTNVAATNINNRFPDIRSETLANMFHSIYTATFPGQSLSQPSTVANSLRLLNPGSQYFNDLGFDENELASFIGDFATRLEQFDQTGFKRVDLQQELKRLSNLIEGNLSMTISILDAVEQTILELEPIVIHHMLLNDDGHLNIPQEYQELNYIITDESQDISTFEYILLLELTIHYRSQLLIIGDGSQTLYEFRNSDPRYMNALESSNVFTSHKLETNYRSDEEILMYANQFLQVIDANQFANIQLASATFSVPSKQSLRKAVTVSDNPVMGRATKDYTESLVTYIKENKNFQNWFIKRVKNGEQVALMGWTRREIMDASEAIQELLAQHNLGHIEITNIMRENERPMTILSRFARVKNQILRSLDPTNVNYLSAIEGYAEEFVKETFPRSSQKQGSFYEDLINRSVKAVVQTREWYAWVMDYRAGNVNQYQIGSFLIQQLLRMETRKNAMDQFLRKQKEIPNYDECPIIVSTIHGTKGLEFDHTVVFYNEGKNGSTSQESLRMMFVALSRAKKSEWIVNSFPDVKKRTVTDSHIGMFQTPMNTAYMRTLNDVEALQNQANLNTPIAS